ncbi:group 1 glycosyl transferase [Tolypothrix sp. NIES-4075]|uniref:glycosyltransferase family 4 protein n=1 Tax=Tolypothrix sp. NIES-4075 TaxID=2005459 RepID=UPI000B5C7B88|nr:glycosyltransferase family 4 protein [Tolypothrix sp. NIES-4075]GAX40378.1 group 1 glycosyl transferase [Tolypothrix sp. NIES-4075]
MKILFLDQSGKPGGAELCLIDIAKPYSDRCLVGLFADGSFKNLLIQNKIPVQVLATQAIQVRKESSLAQGLGSLGQLAPIITKVVKIAREYDLIYANTQKALVVGAIASFLSRRPLVYHLHDILSEEHFSKTNRRIAVTCANRFASLVIANSQASKTAFVKAGGRTEITEIVYNGFDSKNYLISESDVKQLRQELGLEGQFVVGHFSRLAPWKGQHILIEALAKCPQEVTVLLVGDALFGEQDYVESLHTQVKKMGLEKRVKFLGFSSDIPQLMSACDLVAHTSISPEPFGRVIVEAMLCGTPVVAAEEGGAIELVEHDINGFLATPGKPQELAQIITACLQEPEKTAAIANNARITASQRFDVTIINQQIAELLERYFECK